MIKCKYLINWSGHLMLIFFIIIILCPITSYAQTPPIIYVAGDGSGDYNCDENKDQVQINQALDFVAANPDYTTVYLKGANTFLIDEPIIISSNTILTGDSSAKLKLKDYVEWWTYDKPMIAQKGRVGWDPYGDLSESISNVEIHGFEINGGLQSEPTGNRYNTFIHFTYPYNISIYDMYMEGGEWDAVRLSSSGGPNQDVPQHTGNSKIYNNLIKHCGHDAISFVGVANFEAYGNKIYSTRTNSGIRATEADSLSFYGNIIGNSIASPSSGYAGIIIQNGLVPFSYAEIYDNLIYGKNGGIHIGSVVTDETYPTGSRKNVHIHHNKIYKINNAITQGNNLVLHGGISINGFQNTLIEYNAIEGGTTDGIVYEGQAGGGNGYETIVRNNIIINNGRYGISNKESSVHTFISSNNLVYNNGVGNYNNTTSNNDINSDPLFGNTHSTLDQWHHIVASYDNATETFKIYVDGTEKASQSLPGMFGTIGSNSYNLLLGAIYNESTWFEGQQDELGIWNRALTADEVNLLYNDGDSENIEGALTSGLQAYFKMENNWNDSSGNGFNMEDVTAAFTTDAINGNYAGLFDGSTGVQYPNNLSTANGLSISVWVNRAGLDEYIQTIVSKGKQTDNNHIWLHFRRESIILELGNGTTRYSLEARIIDPVDLDFHVKSAYGRWNGSQWVNDTETSPCVDGGVPESDFANEPSPNGGRVNVGIYGNTNQASKSEISEVLENTLNTIALFPNPTTGKIYLSNQFKSEYFQIISPLGIIVRSGIISTKEIDLNGLPSGVYFIQITETKSGIIKLAKVIKE